MIDELPLDVFAEDDTTIVEHPAPVDASQTGVESDPAATTDTGMLSTGPAAPTPAASAELCCLFCGQASPASVERCPTCGTPLSPVVAPVTEQPVEPAHACQWCETTLQPSVKSCPVRGSKVPDPSMQLLGLNVARPSAEFVFAPSLHHVLVNPYLGTDLKFRIACELLRMFLGRGL